MSSFRVWAPHAQRVHVVVDGREHAMHADGRAGWWSADVAGAAAGCDYAYRLDGGPPRPDPRSAWQPQGVHGPSRLVDHAAFAWSDQTWHGVPLPGSVVYELHIGTFTDEGTFDAAIARLDHLVELGVDVVELMPVNAFDGDRGWGYDGVLWYAVHDPYGGPDGLKRFVDAAHGRGIGVLLDVVYNHLGPSGNYLSEFGPYFTDTHSTPWGPAVNLDAPESDEVRRHIIDNALMWFVDYHVDGLRLDAVHELKDDRATHVLEELSEEVRRTAAYLRKPLFLVAESDRNDPRNVTPRHAGGWGLDAQWSDDFHHALHALLTGERQGYYCDFGSLQTLAKAFTRVFVHDGTYSTFRRRHHGRPVDPHLLSGAAFVSYLQNHDQIGNRAGGARLAAMVPPDLLKIGAALVLTGPFTPMLFMGEEWGASTPWQFFASFPDRGLAEAVRTGRCEEFAGHGWDPARVPDPMDGATFARSTLDWAEVEKEAHADLLAWHRDLIALRRRHPELTDGRLDAVRCTWDDGDRWFVLHRGGVAVVCNLAEEHRRVPAGGRPGEVLLASASEVTCSGTAVNLPARSVAVVLID
jgi:maltooligosyltrehalose trehalohydrolase